MVYGLASDSLLDTGTSFMLEDGDASTCRSWEGLYAVRYLPRGSARACLIELALVLAV